MNLCKTCKHPEREAIEKAIASGSSKADISADFGVSADSVKRHARKHLPRQLAAARERRKELEESAEQAEAIGHEGMIVDKLLELTDTTKKILSKAAGDPELALRAITRLERQLELQARLLGALKDGNTTVNINVESYFVSPEWLKFQNVLVDAVESYPAIRAKLLSATEGLYARA